MKPLPTFCRCETLASLRDAHLGSFFLEPEDIKNPNLGGHLALWQGGRAPLSDVWGTNGWFIKDLGASGLKGPEPLPVHLSTDVSVPTSTLVR
jgi:hypothetical protein